MSTTLTTPGGQSIEAPSLAALTEAVDALLAGEDEAADLWLENDDGWALSVVPTGDLFFENVNKDSYQTLGPLPREEIVRLLHLLASDNLADLRAQPWEAGE